MTDHLTFIHLSDVHFSKQSGASVHDLDAIVRNELTRDAVRLTERVGPVAGVLITGDIAFSGVREEYEKAAKWLNDFCGSVGCAEDAVWVVPGNHDVDRRVAAKSKAIRLMHDRLRSLSVDALDAELHELCTDPQTAKALLEPLAEYNLFAARYGCAISPEQLFWERDLSLPCNTKLRLRGLCSVLVSNGADAKGKMVLGSAQASVPRTPGVEYFTLCHHPLDWLHDQDAVSDQLDKVRVQLFGHKHSQRVQAINDSVRLTAGAMHPERNDKDWEPAYNVLQVRRRDDHFLAVSIYQRRWHKAASKFVPDHDPNTGAEHYEKLCASPLPGAARRGATTHAQPWAAQPPSPRRADAAAAPAPETPRHWSAGPPASHKPPLTPALTPSLAAVLGSALLVAAAALDLVQVNGHAAEASHVYPMLIAAGGAVLIAFGALRSNIDWRIGSFRMQGPIVAMLIMGGFVTVTLGGLIINNGEKPEPASGSAGTSGGAAAGGAGAAAGGADGLGGSNIAPPLPPVVGGQGGEPGEVVPQMGGSGGKGPPRDRGRAGAGGGPPRPAALVTTPVQVTYVGDLELTSLKVKVSVRGKDAVFLPVDLDASHNGSFSMPIEYESEAAEVSFVKAEGCRVEVRKPAKIGEPMVFTLTQTSPCLTPDGAGCPSQCRACSPGCE